jgi:nicotinate-nucleotide--dimethylbenzimidazole phosphoribosyltransferase
MDLFEAINKRRDTRHFTSDEVPESVINLCLKAAKQAPSVGLTEPARFIFIRDIKIRQRIYDNFLVESNKALEKIKDEQKAHEYKNLQLQCIMDAPLGMIVCSDYSTLKNHTIGVQSMPESIDWSVVCAIQNFWLALTSQEYSLGWVSILNGDELKGILNLPVFFKPLGYFCIGKPSTDYDKMPMLRLKGWTN